MAGLVVLPGVVNTDHTRDIMLTCYTVTPPIFIKKDACIAQLIFFPTKDIGEVSSTSKDTQTPGLPGSPIVSLIQQMENRPVVTVLLAPGSDTRVLSMMLDTEADVTIVSRDLWPKPWKLIHALDAVQGVGGGSNPQQSAQPVQLKFPEGQTVTLRPYVMPLPDQLRGLIGREVMSQLGAVLSVPEPAQNL
ncbi:endogenous retrovirus group K member 9 Pol protein-like protein [Willisornis vidua]|uniref:Endogenous retrovirus group K member 9 Pol protein-like protein n=1 Tax=Willisornis vidua TaxID=1566151 RepID=A0ABQ9D995_9PASS|nr:endogenous retrovirus group K member 9 Pol protein-like protein [Willisornis vidua]